MKQTVFRFGIRSHAADAATQLQSVKDSLVAIRGVVAVGGTLTDDLGELFVRAEFKDGKAAIKLHRKIMNALIGIESLTVTFASTNLTDVFG